jgi:hypothetical protein
MITGAAGKEGCGMQDQTFKEDVRRLMCTHAPVIIELAIAGDDYRLRSCTRCGWTEWVTGVEDCPCELGDVLVRLASRSRRLRSST